MFFFLFISGVILIRAAAGNEDDECKVLINGKIVQPKYYHDVEILKEDLNRPHMLAVDYSTNNLYFSYTVNEINYASNQIRSRSARLNLNTKEFNIIEGVTNGYAQTVDQETHEIYIGGSNGIYKYDYGKNKAKIIGEKDSFIRTLYFNKVLYYTVHPTQRLTTFVDGESRRFNALKDTKVLYFVIDNEGDIFFSNFSGLFSQKKGTKEAVLYNEKSDMWFTICLATDMNGNVYACLQDGIYAVRKLSKSLEKVADVNNPWGLAFDNKNNMLYSDNTKLVRLTPNKHKTC